MSQILTLAAAPLMRMGGCIRTRMVSLPSFPGIGRNACIGSGTGRWSIARAMAASSRAFPDLGDLAAYGDTDKDAVAHVTELAGERVRAAVDDGQPVPPRRHSSEMPSHIRSKEVGRAIIPVEVGRREAWPTPPYHMSA